MKSKYNIMLLEFDLHVIFTILMRNKINPKYFAKITFNNEMCQCLTATAEVTFVTSHAKTYTNGYL